MKKNYNHVVTTRKYINFIIENKIIFFIIILFLLTFRVECNNNGDKIKWGIACVPLRVQDVKEIVK